MWYVYVIKSTKCKYKYVGATNDLERRVEKHNKGICKATKSYRPFELAAYLVVKSKDKAIKLERYLKTGSGAAFLEKRIL